MKRCCSLLLILALLLPCLALGEEEARDEGFVIENSRTGRVINFTYPAIYEFVDDGKNGSYVFSSDGSFYVRLMVDAEGTPFYQSIANRHKDGEVLLLTEDFCIASTAESYLNDYLLDVAFQLDNGSAMVLQVICYPGKKTAYPLLLDLIGEFTDATPVESWLNDAWLPYIMAAEQGN